MPGGQRTSANIAIEAALTIRMVFQLPLRQTEGFLRSLVDMLDVEIPIPDHTTLSRRLKTLGEIPFRVVASHRPIHLFIDSTGLSVVDVFQVGLTPRSDAETFELHGARVDIEDVKVGAAEDRHRDHTMTIVVEAGYMDRKSSSFLHQTSISTPTPTLQERW